MKAFYLPSDTIAKIRAWGVARNIIAGTASRDQFVKCASEVGELADGIAKKQPEMIKDAIGDVVVMLTIIGTQEGFEIEKLGGVPVFETPDSKDAFMHVVDKFGDAGWAIRACVNTSLQINVMKVLGYLAAVAEHEGLKFNDCIEFAYNQIKDRKGVVYNGTFIKSTDPRYQSALAELGLSE